MSTYVKTGKNLEFDNAPDWLAGYMLHRRTLMGNSPKTVMTDFISLREFFQWMDIYLVTGSTPGSVEVLRSRDILDMPMEKTLQIKRSDIEAYLYYVANTLGNSEVTRNRKLNAIKCYYDYLLDRQEELHIQIEVNPADRIKKVKPPKKQPIILPQNERKALLENIDGENRERDYLILLLLATCGLRVSEVVSISLRDVNLKSGSLRIHGKGNKERIVYPTEYCLEKMESYILGYRKKAIQDNTPAAPFFVSMRTGKRITSRSVERAMAKHVNAAGIGGMGYTPHKLRHTAASIMARDGIPMVAIQKVLGHESLTTTQIYTHMSDREVEEAISASSLSELK